MRVGILTSTETRHRHFVRRVAEHFDVAAVVCEETGYSPAHTDGFGLTETERSVVDQHYADRAREEERMGVACCAGETVLTKTPTRRADKANLNTEATIRFLADACVNVVLVYGTDLIRPPLLGAYEGRMVNMHLGLSPYYRGTATNFYPLLNEEPEFVGATIHLIDAGIDSGAIQIGRAHV